MCADITLDLGEMIQHRETQFHFLKKENVNLGLFSHYRLILVTVFLIA